MKQQRDENGECFSLFSGGLGPARIAGWPSRRGPLNIVSACPIRDMRDLQETRQGPFCQSCCWGWKASHGQRVSFMHPYETLRRDLYGKQVTGIRCGHGRAPIWTESG